MTPALMLDPVYLTGLLLFGLALMIPVLSAVFLISAIDDLVIDLTFWLRWIYRASVKRRRIRTIDAAMLRAKPEQWIAVMVPAWDESAVIEAMLHNLLARADYEHFRIFVGMYPNDAATCAAVARVAAADPRVVEVLNRRPGPTCKADCLNAIHAAIGRYESVYGCRFEIYSMQDCEDVVHPLAWRLFNWLIPRKDMVQLPVLSLPRRWWQWTAAHYQDEFAQLHFKDLVAREALAGNVPAAGVGVAFSRRALAAVAAENAGEPFNAASLTEDYDVALRLRRNRMKLVFAVFRVRPEPGAAASRGALVPYPKHQGELVCVREYFPDHLRAAVRQKARWVIGIALQGWRAWGWRSDPWGFLMFWRDRKVLLTNPAAALGYLVVLAVLAQWTWQWIDPLAPAFPPLVEAGSLTQSLLIANLVVLVLRVLQRAVCVSLLHGLREGLLSPARMVWASLINCLATIRALRLWLRHRLTGAPIGWDKTAHQYPTQAELGLPSGVPEVDSRVLPARST
jgi:adsorption protein B